jgi:lipoate-protein ligase A
MTSPISNSWRLLKSGAGQAAWNMAVDGALLETAASIGQPILRFYSWSEPAATFGYFQKYDEVAQATLLRPLVRRTTGGGLVPHDADWTYSVIIPPGDPWYELKAVESYRRMHEWICAAFRQMNIITELAPDCLKCAPGQCFVGYEKFDVLWHEKKIAGAAQRRTRDGLLIQGSVQPPPIKIERADWENAMCEVASNANKILWTDLPFDAALEKHTQNLAATTFSQDTHNRRR